jgi:hypothetical protein
MAQTAQMIALPVGGWATWGPRVGSAVMAPGASLAVAVAVAVAAEDSRQA